MGAFAVCGINATVLNSSLKILLIDEDVLSVFLKRDISLRISYILKY